MPDTAVLSTLQHVTEKKLEKLAEHRKKFDTQRASIHKWSSAGKTPDEQVRALLDGSRQHNISLSGTGLSAKNIERFLDQAKSDPSVSPAVLRQWKAKLERNLEVQGLKYEYAGLFGQLVTEWIENPNDASAAKPKKPIEDDESDEHSGSESVTSFEQVGREEMHEQRKEWESYAFNARNTDVKAIEKYLDELFGKAYKAKARKVTPLEQLRTDFAALDDFTPTKFSTATVRTCIKSLLKADLFAGEKRRSLADLVKEEDALAEIADVLNMDLDSLQDWEWETQPVPLNMRRQLNGKYRVFMDEELHQAILLQFVGSKLAALMKTAFLGFFRSGAWLVSPYNSMKKEDRLRRAYYLDEDRLAHKDSTVRNTRRTTFMEDYFMTQLPNSFTGGTRDYGANEDDDDDDEKQKSPMVIKQSLLRLATTEALINTKLYGAFTILQTDFKWFGPSLPHSTMYTVLRYFGLKPKWLTFIRKFLEVPVAFASDGPKAEGRKRACGIPMSHTLSDAVGEAVLFCLDFAVNQRTHGGNLYRFHDDLWFWGQEKSCVQAWKAIKEFSGVMGMDLNQEKTGSIRMQVDDKKASSELPVGPVRWGFLELDAKTGRWTMCQKEIEEHIKELRRQLGACRSVFAWVQAYNSYVDRFFSNNFGQPATCLGREHVQLVISTFEHIHKSLFGDDGNVVDVLRKRIKERFGVDDIPNGFFFLPIDLGGLELRNPFISLFAQVRHPKSSPQEIIETAFDHEEEAWERLKDKFDSGRFKRDASLNYTPKNPDEFMSLEEYTRFMEETSACLDNAYDSLMEDSSMDNVESTPEIMAALGELPQTLTFGKSGFSRSWRGLGEYWQWVLELFAADMIRRFGGLVMADAGLIPIGLVKMMRSERVRWQS